ncbi:MAG: exported protein of unknown function [Chloroflexi bacterium]|nr:exported protein of unknown function [Chloroflexota bacterium]
MKPTNHKSLIFIILILALVGCTYAPIPGAPSANQPGSVRNISPTSGLFAELLAKPPETTDQTSSLPVSVQYNLGETTIIQARFPEGNRFRYMPVRLNGIIAVPDGKNGPYPVVVIMHGNHLGCPISEGGMVDRWPCDPAVERPNSRGFDYLVRRLAAEGYVALSINVNAENTLGFGEPDPIERLQQLVDLHLKALSAANSGGSNQFGVELKGLAEMNRLAFIGHSQGGEGAYWLTQKEALDAPDASTRLGYGPVYGLLMVAPSANFGGAQAARLPLAVILPACDNDVFLQDGQLFYEITRLDPEAPAWASSVWLEGANHNYFNSTLKDEAVSRPNRPDCQTLLAPEAQRDFLSEYAIDFLAKIFNKDPGATTRLGMDFKEQAQDKLYGLSARVAGLAPQPDRLPLLIPKSATELETNLAGGSVSAENVTTIFCEFGYFVPSMKPGSEPCKRVNMVVPGNPAMIVTSWTQSGGALHLALPEGLDLSQFSAISLRAAVDPLSTLNKAGAEQVFTVQLVDKNENSASVHTQADEPALQFPVGNEVENDTFEGGWFTGRAPLTTIRMLLHDFTGIDLSAIREITLLLDQSPSGTLFISDLEVVR